MYKHYQNDEEFERDKHNALVKKITEKFANRLKEECERIYFGENSYIEICDKSKIDKVCKEFIEKNEIH